MIRQSPYREGRNQEYSQRAYAEGAQLQTLVDAGIHDQAKLEATIEKAGFTQDGLGQWFKVVGAEPIKVPIPVQFQPEALKRGQVPMQPLR